MLIMLVSIMVGVVIITFFSADIIRRTQIETMQIEHKTEISSITSKNENFTNNFFQGITKLDSAREIREVGNYHFDFALFWYTNVRTNVSDVFVQNCINNCTDAMTSYETAYSNFNISKPFFETAIGYTNQSKYIEVLGYYVTFAQSGKQISLLRYNASQFLKQAVENLSNGDMTNVSLLMTLFNETEALYNGAMGGYSGSQGQIDEYWFFDTIREPH